MRAHAWDEVELGSLADFRNGVNYTKDSFGVGVRVLNVKDFQDYSVPRYHELDEINPYGVVRENHLLSENDIVFVRSNGNKELIGRSVMILSPPPEPLTHSAFSIRARFISEEAVPRFYSYVLRSGLIRQALSAQGSGTNISNLNQDILSRLRVPLPPRPVQERIAFVLSAYDDLIENNTRRIAILEEMARRLYEEWFVHFRFPGHDGGLRDDIPAGWHWGTLSELAQPAGRSVDPSQRPDETFAHYSFPAFDAGLQPELALGSTIMSNKLAFSAPAVLLAKLNPRIARVWPVLDKSENTQLASTEFVPLVPRDGWSTALVEAAMRSSSFRSYLTGLAAGTSTSHQRVKPKEVMNAPLALPGPALLAEAERTLAPMQQQRVRLRRAITNLRAQRDMLLPKLVSGEIDLRAAAEMLEAAA